MIHYHVLGARAVVARRAAVLHVVAQLFFLAQVALVPAAVRPEIEQVAPTLAR